MLTKAKISCTKKQVSEYNERLSTTNGAKNGKSKVVRPKP